MVLVLIRSASWGTSNEYPQHMWNKKHYYMNTPLNWSYGYKGCMLYGIAYMLYDIYVFYDMASILLNGSETEYQL